MKKIMFNDKYGLTQAVLEGRKTQTRRIVPVGAPLGSYAETVKYAQYKEGEIVAVAQNYKDAGCDFYFHRGLAGWNNKMFVRAEEMPHRIRIDRIRIERLRKICNEECLKEGIGKRGDTPLEFFVYGEDDILFDTPQRAFASLIDKTCGKGTWQSNPWVFVYDFELVK